MSATSTLLTGSSNRLLDGQPFASITLDPVADVTRTLTLSVRAYKTLLVLLIGETATATGTATAPAAIAPRIKSSEYIKDLGTQTSVALLSDVAAIVATPTQLLALGLAIDGVVPGNPDGVVIPFTLDPITRRTVADAPVKHTVGVPGTLDQLDTSTSATTYSSGEKALGWGFVAISVLISAMSLALLYLGVKALIKYNKQ